jgi:hypothetical protein
MPLSHEPAPPERRRRRGRRDDATGNDFDDFWDGPANRDSGGPAPPQTPTRGQAVSGAYGGAAAGPGPSTGAYRSPPAGPRQRTGAYPATAPYQGDTYATDA